MDFEIENGVLKKYTGTAAVVSIPAGVTEIGDYAFMRNQFVTNVVIPKGVKRLDEGAFYQCKMLKEVTLPDDLEEIGYIAFFNCESLHSIVIPTSVRKIGNSAFMNCWNLAEVEIPSTNIMIGDGAFLTGEKSKRVTLVGDPQDSGALQRMKELLYNGLYEVEFQWKATPGVPKASSAAAKPATAGKKKAENSTAKKRTSSITIGAIQKLLDEYESERGRDAVSSDELSAAMGREKFEGIHEVTGHSEWISPNGIWAMRVPAGFSYTMDANHTKKIESFDLQFDAQIQLTGKVNFRIERHTPFTMSVIPILGILQSDDGCANLLSREAQAAIEQYKARIPREWNVVKLSSDVVVLYISNMEESEGVNVQSIMYAVMVSGCTAVTGGEITMACSLGEPLLSLGMSFLKSIVKFPRVPASDGFEPTVLPQELRLRYNEGRNLKLDDGRHIPIPDGYKGTTDTSLIKRQFSIVPQTLPYWDGDGDYKYLPLDLSMMNANINVPTTRASMSGYIAREVVQQFPAGIMNPNGPFFLARQTENSTIFYQELSDLGDTSAALIRAMEIAAKQVRLYTIRMNFHDIPLNQFNRMRYEASMLACSWLSRLPKDEEEIYHPDALLIKPIEALRNDVHEHLDLVSSGRYTTRRDADFVGQPIRTLMEETGCTYEDAYDMMEMPNDTYSLDADARELARVFRLNASLFDPYSDTEAMIRIGMFADVRMFHALRSLAWTVSCKAEREGRQLSSYRFEELKEIGAFIEEKEYLNYASESYCSGLCSHCDWRVFYVPDAYIGSDCEGSTDLRNLCGKENRSGNTVTISIPSLGIGGFDEMNQINRLINRNEETLESLEALREDLQKLLPVMQTIHDGFMEGRNRAKKLEGPLADALTAWCALAVAAKEPFYSEEASDQPETNAGLKGPLERPDDALPAAGSASSRTRGTSSKRAKANASKPAAPKPSGDVLNLDGATTIAPNQFAGNMTLRNVVIPEGVTEIGQGAFNSCMFLETVTFPKSLKKIGDFAFMSCRNLKRVEFAEGIEELGDHAFGATSSLKEVHFPESLKRVDRTVFGMGGDSPHATAHLSGRLAWQLYENSQGNFQGIYARHLVIDGEPYDDMQDYISTSKKPVRNHAPAKAPQASRVSQAPKASQTPQAEADESAQRKMKYRERMEAACKAGKSLQEMIDAARAAVASKKYSDKDGFEQAVQMLDRDAVVTVPGKHFVLSGFGVNEAMMVDEIQKRGGIVHSGVVKMADYLVLYLNAPGVVKAMRALEWREKGAKTQIVSDYQLWQVMLGTAPVVSDAASKIQGTAKEEKPESHKAADPAPAKQAEPSTSRQQRRAAQQEKISRTASTHARSTRPDRRKYGWIGEILPEGSNQAAIERELEAMSDEEAAKKIDAYRELRTREQKSNENQLARVRIMAEQEAREREARRKQEAEEQARREREAEERAQKERERQELARKEQEAERRRIEDQKAAERMRIQKEISALSQEMASLTGMLAVFKRRKLQKRIDELNEQLRKL